MNNTEKIEKIIELIKNSDCILIGAGAGLSAAGGINYSDQKFFKEHYPMYYKKGIRTIGEAEGHFWKQNDRNLQEYWAFWSIHLNDLYYQIDTLEIYKDLYDIIKDKDYFVYTTNADEQFDKAGFSKDRFYYCQGSFKYFQCSNKCTDDVYDNKEIIENILKNMDYDTLKARMCDIPHCPKCGSLMTMNLRIDDLFAEYVNYITKPLYIKWLKEHKNKKLLLLELGVGFNTPILIKYPFENMTYQYPDCFLVRINYDGDETSDEIKKKSIVLQADLLKTIKTIKDKLIN